MHRVDKDWTKNWKKGIAFRVNSPRLKVNIRLAIWRMTMKIIKSLTDCDKRFWTRLKKKKISVSLFNFSIPTNVKETYLIILMDDRYQSENFIMYYYSLLRSISIKPDNQNYYFFFLIFFEQKAESGWIVMYHCDSIDTIRVEIGWIT